jgi:hypothetical protein
MGNTNAPFGFYPLDKKYKECVVAANCPSNTKKQCKQMCEQAITENYIENGYIDVKKDECKYLPYYSDRQACKKTHEDFKAKIPKTGGKRKTPKKSKFKVSRVYRSTRKIR